MPLRLLVTTAVVTLALVVPAGAAGSTTTRHKARADATRVLAISIDGLNTDAIRRLRVGGTPTLHRMLAQGAGTLNARTEYERTNTLPNHTGMLTGRRVQASRGGHGVTWDVDRPAMTVQRAAGRRVQSVFSVVKRSGGTTALFSTKSKFALYERSWPKAIDRFTVDENQRRLVRKARQDLIDTRRTFTFLHFSLPDRAGHAYGGMSRRYLGAVRQTDRLLGTVLGTIRSHRTLRNRVAVVLTADHGFAPGQRTHSAVRLLANYRVPFIAWNAGVTHAGLYRLNPDYRNPKRSRPGYAARRQPIRNGDLGNLALDLLGLGSIPGSDLDQAQNLDVR